MKTIIDLLENSAQKYPNNPYILEKKTEKYEALTYKETREQVYKVAAGLMSLGIKKGDRVAFAMTCSLPAGCLLQSPYSMNRSMQTTGN